MSILMDDRFVRATRARVRSAVPAAMAVGLVSVSLAAGVQPPPPPPQVAKVVKTGYKIKEIAKGLDHPWSMAFLPDGSILVTERVGRLRLIQGGLLRPEPIGGVPAGHTGSQAGVFG